MSLLFMEGFDYIVTGDLAARGWAVVGGVTINANGRRGTRGLAPNLDSYYAYRYLNANYSTLIAGVAYVRTQALSASGSVCIIAFTDGTPSSLGSSQIHVRWDNVLGRLLVYRGTTLIGTTSVTLLPYQYYYIELKVVFHASAGSYELRVGGTTVLSGSGISTISSANQYANIVSLYASGAIGGGAGNAGNATFDDLYICDASGSVNNDFLGDCRVDLVMPTSEGTHSDFTPSTGADNSATIDELTASAVDYNSADVVGSKDTYNMQDLVPLLDSTVYAVQPVMLANSNNAGSRSVVSLVRSGGVDVESAVPQLLGTAGRYYADIRELNPDGSVPWTQSSVNAAEFGVKIET